MATYSMTGYGKGEITKGNINIIVEIKSVNHRYLDLGIRIPKIFNPFEDKMRKLIKEKVSRGHLDIYVTYRDYREERTKIQVDIDLAKQYVKMADKLSKTLGVTNDIEISKVLSYHDVLTQEEVQEKDEILEEILLSSLDKALSMLVKQRLSEGERLKKELLDYLNQVEKDIKSIEKLSACSIKNEKEKLNDKIQEIFGDIEFSEERLISEIVYLTDKAGIDEELVRLKSHIVGFRKIFDRDGTKGKSLDFLLIEMNREVNTIASKCNNSEIAQKVVKIKTELEKIREQVQNIE